MMEPPGGVGDATVTSSLDAAEDEELGTASVYSIAASGLKPKLDSIFSEVEQNLPEIDFDLSDIGSDNEEPIIFHQHLKTMALDEEKDLDTSQDSLKFSSGSNISPTENMVEEITKSVEEFGHNLNQSQMDRSQMDKNQSKDSGTDPIMFYDNDLAYELQQSGIDVGSPEVTSWHDIPKENRDNKTSSEQSNVSSWHDIPNDNDNKTRNMAELNLDKNEGGKQRSVFGKQRPLSETEKQDREMKKKIEREKSRNEQRELASSILSPRAPLLSMQALTNIDLDNLLHTINEDNRLSPSEPRQAWSIMDPESLIGAGEGVRRRNTENESMTLIQKLAKMTMEQSGEDLSDIDPRTGARRKTIAHQDNRDLEEQDGVDEESEVIHGPTREVGEESRAEKNEAAAVAGYLDENKVENAPQVKKQTASCGTNTGDFVPRVITPRVPPSQPPPKPSCPELKSEDKDPTVFIDLRNFEEVRQQQQQSIEKVQKVLGIDPSERKYESSSDSDDDDMNSWREQRQRFKQTVASRGVSTKPLPNKPRPISHKKPQRVINMADRQLPQQQAPPTEQQQPITVVEIEAQRRAQAEEREKQRRQEIVRKLREQRESEHQAKLRLQKRLEALRPSASISGRQDPAETTPIIFDLESSYEPSPRSLPAILSQDKECLLLNIHLSSNGELVLHRGNSNKSVDTGVGLSASYTTLLTWLLSLVPGNFAYLQHDNAKPEVTSPWMLPFYVIGCQQMLMDDQLYLMVAVTPVEQFDAKWIPTKARKSKSKDDLKGTSAFHQHLTKYLSTNTLHSVCPWLQDMVSTDVRPHNTNNSENSYAYRPPLPNITTKPLSTYIEVSPDNQAASKVFNTSVGFFWQTVDSDEGRLDQPINDSEVSCDIQNTMSLVYKKIFTDPRSMMGVFNRVLQEGLDLAGVRLVYPTPELIGIPKTDNSEAQSELELLNKIGPVLAVCLRGTLARSIWLDAVGPSDPVLARRTDPNSLCALYGGDSRDECLLFCPRNATRVQQELTRWFGGRVPPGNVIDVGAPYTRKETLRSGSPKGRKTKKVSFSDTKDKDGSSVNPQHVHRPLATLTATTKSEIFLVLSPLVPPKCFGLIMATCQRRGYYVRGIKRCRLSTKRAVSLGISGKSLTAFCPGTCSSPMGAGSFDEALAEHLNPHKQSKQLESAHPSTIFQLEKENASHSAASLVEACMVQMTMQGIMADVQKRENFPVESKHMFHTARYSDGLLNTLGGEFSKCFDPEIQINPNYVIPELYTNPELEQITTLLLLGHDIMKTCGLFIGRILSVVPRGKVTSAVPLTEGLELLGMKWLPCLTMSQAKEITPYEAGDRLWKDNVHTLTNEPCLVLALRGINAFSKLESVIPSQQNRKPGVKGHLDMIHSRSAEQAYSFMRLFFMERELFSDPLSRPLLPYIPHHLHMDDEEGHPKRSRHLQTYPHEESIFDIMTSGPMPLTTFLLIKPRAVQRHLPKILKKIVHEGFQVVGLRFEILTKEKAQGILAEDFKEEATEKHLNYLTSGPSLYLALQRENAVKKLLDLIGPQDPQSARRLSQFYWRGVFGADPVCNAFYCSGTYSESVEDLKTYFTDGLCCKETDVTQHEMITCPGNDSIILPKFSSIRDIMCHPTAAVHADSATESSHTLLLQTTCIVLSPLLMKKLGSHYGYVDIMEGLVSQGFEFVGGRMVWFTEEQAQHFLCNIDAGSFQMVPLLTSGPSIVLALQRDNAVLAFDTILRETFSKDQVQGRSTTDSLLHKYGQLILRPADISQAHNLLGFFFDQLLPNSQIEIVQKTGNGET